MFQVFLPLKRFCLSLLSSIPTSALLERLFSGTVVITLFFSHCLHTCIISAAGLCTFGRKCNTNPKYVLVFGDSNKSMHFRLLSEKLMISVNRKIPALCNVLPTAMEMAKIFEEEDTDEHSSTSACCIPLPVQSTVASMSTLHRTSKHIL